MKKLCAGLVLAACTAGAVTNVVYMDDFSGDGPLNGRTPTMGTNNNWNAHANLVVTNGVLMSKSKQISGWLFLPAIQTGDVIRVSAEVVGRVTLNTDWVGIGLTTNAAALFISGAPYATMKHGTNNLAIPAKGYFNIYGGTGNKLIDQNGLLDESKGYTMDLNARNKVILEYDTSTGNLKASLRSANGTLFEHYNGSVNFGAVAGAAIPLDKIRFLGVTFNTSEFVSTANPAFIDNLLVEIISVPEPVDWYGEWIGGYDVGTATDMTDDADGDLLDNLAEYALGGNPSDGNDTGFSPVGWPTTYGGTNGFAYVHAQRANADEIGLAYRVEQSTDLVFGNWTNADYAVVGTGVLVPGEFDTVTNFISTAEKNQQFLRLAIDAE